MRVSLKILLIVGLWPLVPYSYDIPKLASQTPQVIQQSQTGDFSIVIQPNQLLVQQGRSASPAVGFTPLNGFVGQVSVSFSMSPVTANAPTIRFTYNVMLNYTQFSGNTYYPFAINATNNTPLGLYMITATGTNGSLVHSTSASVGVTNVAIPSNGAELFYNLGFDSPAHPGNTIFFVGNFSDLGYVQVEVIRVTVLFDWGMYGGVPSNGVLLGPLKNGIYSFAVTIPNNISPGTYAFTATISWVLDPYHVDQTQQPDVVAHGTLPVTRTSPLNPVLSPSFYGLLLPIMAAELVFTAASIFVVHRHERKKQARMLDRDAERSP